MRSLATCASGKKWTGNFQPGVCGASGVLAVLGRTDQALVLARGPAYVVEPETAALLRTFGGQICDVFTLVERKSVILGNGLWFECVGREGLRWRTRRFSWDGMVEAALDGERLGGQAFNPIDNTWSPFEVDTARRSLRSLSSFRALTQNRHPRCRFPPLPRGIGARRKTVS